jgi:hypothetical protein
MIVDTCYDADHVIACHSRRLPDLCQDLRLRASQPELRDASRGELRRRSLQPAGVAAREKVTLLNLRNSLSTALIAAHAAGVAHWPGTLDVNRILAAELAGDFGWPSDPAFIASSGESR